MKRIMILLILIAIALVAVLGRLVYIQVVRGGEFTDKAAQMMHFVEPLEARRGRILDRFGGMPGAAVLAFDEPCWDLGLDYRFLVLVAADRNWGVKVDTKFLDKAQRWKRHRVQEIAKADKVSSEEAEKVFAARAQTTMTWAGNAAEDAQTDLEAVMRRTIARVEHIRQMLRRREKGPPREEEWAHPVVRGLGAAMKVALDGHMADMVGAVIRDSHKRCYPHLDIACHVIGRTGPVDAAEQERYNLHDDADLASRIRTNYLDGDTIGKNGAELLYEDVLRGRRGYRKRNRYTGEVIEEVPAAEGKDVRLTIDLALQRRITEQFAGRRYTGAAAVIYVPTGEVLALVSYPTHDLNLFGREFEALAKDVIMLPMRHRAVSQLYPPGSSIKPLVALAGLSTNAITPQTVFTCYRHLFPDMPTRWRCLGLHNEIEVRRAIKASCNVFFYHVGEALTAPRLRWWFEQAGFSQRPGTRLPDEHPGHLATGNTPGMARMMGIGQSFGVTPLHMANAVATLVRNGEFLSPRICLDEATPQVRRKLPVTSEALQVVRDGMAQVVNESGGTGYKVFHEGEPLKVAVCGKTGTAQAAPQRIDSNGDGRIDRSDPIVRQGNMAWFIGYAPRENPEIAFAVVVEYVPQHGNIIAGPLARELVRAAQNRYLSP